MQKPNSYMHMKFILGNLNAIPATAAIVQLGQRRNLSGSRAKVDNHDCWIFCNCWNRKSLKTHLLKINK